MRAITKLACLLSALIGCVGSLNLKVSPTGVYESHFEIEQKWFLLRMKLGAIESKVGELPANFSGSRTPVLLFPSNLQPRLPFYRDGVRFVTTNFSEILHNVGVLELRRKFDGIFDEFQENVVRVPDGVGLQVEENPPVDLFFQEHRQAY